MLVSKRKRYLSGSDWVINTLDLLMRAATSSGNICQVVLTLDAPLAEPLLRAHLTRFLTKFPVLWGRVARDWKLTPYWKIPPAARREPHLTVSFLPTDPSAEALLVALAENANRPFPHHQEYLDFHLFSMGERAALAMRFDHRLFDARGAESLLHLLQQSLTDDTISGDIAFRSSMELTQWRHKFQAGKQVNRAVIALAQAQPQALPLPAETRRGYGYRLLAFDPQETAAIYEKAYREAGYLMESPYFLAVITQAMHELFTARGGDGSSYLIPVTLDLRPGKDPLPEIFFNHVSYLFYQIPCDLAPDLAGMIALLKQQMYDQVKSGLPRALATASLLTRIMPLALLGKLLHFPMDGKVASFAFSHLGKSAYPATDFMGSSLDRLIHMPRVPAQPGIGFFSSLQNERLTLVISYLDGIVSPAEIAMLEAGIRRRLGVTA